MDYIQYSIHVLTLFAESKKLNHEEPIYIYYTVKML